MIFEEYGAQPAVVHLVVQAPAEEVKSIGAREIESKIGAEYKEVAAEPISPDSSVGILLAAGQTDPQAAEERTNPSALASPTRWDPDIAQQMVTRGPNDVNNKFTGHYVWASLNTAPYVLQAQHGLEFEVNIHSDNPLITGSGRPSCTPSNYKDVPFAKNYGWTWSGYTGSPNPPGGTITNLAALGLYADYNDLSDECNRNSIAVGLAIPQDIPLPYTSSQYYFGWSILAPRGIETSNRISAVIQSVSTHWCEANTWMPLTDCMGVWNSGYGVNRPVLGAWRNWVAPNRCWTSMDYGSTTPVAFSCPF